jgi:uncharacterized protein (DUF4213/DUF364 family)
MPKENILSKTTEYVRDKRIIADYYDLRVATNAFALAWQAVWVKERAGLTPSSILR